MQFSLLPFAASDAVQSLGGSCELRGHHITCRWMLDGSPGKIALPPRAAHPERTMSLWEHTCFEIFIGATDEAAYYEFNLSPSGHWNSFSFSDVRTDMAETQVLVCMASSSETQDESRLVVEARLIFEPEPIASRYRVGISAVIEERAGDRYYYALSHDGPRPDFHKRSNHGLVMPWGG